MLLLTISQVNAHLRALLESDELIADIWVKGEISNLKRAGSGHYYFTLKDDKAALDAAMWRSYVIRMTAPLNDGDAVLAHGRISLYEVSGKLQMYVDMVQPAGVGLLHARFQELKMRLESEGLFDESRKRELPVLPRRLGVATSADGAALHDIVTVLQRRCPLVDVLLAPCLVQGEQAADSIVAALKLLYEAGVDVIILARGGGSIEDLWSFNEEKVVRAVFASPVPLISGVGHETDTTMVDYVADVRAPTPSAAAELAVPDAVALTTEIAALRQRMDAAAADHLAAQRACLDELGSDLRQHHPAPRIAQARQQIDDMLRRTGEQTARSLQWQGMHLAALSSQLAALSPQATLQRGYAVVRRAADGSIVLQAGQVRTGDTLDIMLHQGRLVADVTDVTDVTEAADVKTESESL